MIVPEEICCASQHSDWLREWDQLGGR